MLKLFETLSLTIAVFLSEFYIIGCHGKIIPWNLKIDSIFKDYFLSECVLQREKNLGFKVQRQKYLLFSC